MVSLTVHLPSCMGLWDGGCYLVMCKSCFALANRRCRCHELSSTWSNAELYQRLVGGEHVDPGLRASTLLVEKPRIRYWGIVSQEAWRDVFEIARLRASWKERLDRRHTEMAKEIQMGEWRARLHRQCKDDMPHLEPRSSEPREPRVPPPRRSNRYKSRPKLYWLV
jgi:hypothetical protein